MRTKSRGARRISGYEVLRDERPVVAEADVGSASAPVNLHAALSASMGVSAAVNVDSPFAAFDVHGGLDSHMLVGCSMGTDIPLVEEVIAPMDVDPTFPYTDALPEVYHATRPSNGITINEPDPSAAMGTSRSHHFPGSRDVAGKGKGKLYELSAVGGSGILGAMLQPRLLQRVTD